VDPDSEHWVKLKIPNSEGMNLYFRFRPPLTKARDRKSQCCGSGSGRIRIILPDPDGCQFQGKEKVGKLYVFPENFEMLSKILKIRTPLTLMRKKEHCKLTMLLLKGKKYS
jgi:hypothetical protein